VFFIEKKNQKTFVFWCRPETYVAAGDTRKVKVFLLIFFKKEKSS